MSVFQSVITKKYIAASSDKIRAAYLLFTTYFHNSVIQENIKNCKEEQFQEGFLRELFVKILGYTLNPDENYNLITELKNEKDSKKADGAILVKGEVVGIIELKDHKTIDLKQVENQAFGYKNNNRKASYVITSNFERLRFYIDNAIDYLEFNLFTLTYDEFALLWICLAYENIAKDLPKIIKSESIDNENEITKKFYKDYSQFKRALFADMLANNPDYDKLILFKKSQKLLDRLLFILFAEDCGLLPANLISRILEQWIKLSDLDEYRPLYERFKKYFGYLNTGYKGSDYEIFAYNGGLFNPDELLDKVKISDEVLRVHTLRISQYNFASEVDVNILGHIFENSLTEIEEVINSITTIEGLPQTSKRKKDGVFYTPRYITTYIVENTLGKLCSDKKSELEIIEDEYFADKKRNINTKKHLDAKLTTYREWLLSLTICDPACGSGAFLNAALDFLMREHRLIDELTAKILGHSIAFPNIENAILENNLFGVDINEESVEIAKLALWLRTAKPNRKLNSLNNNIKCGNSLISDPEVADEKAFDWHAEFPQVFAKGGFDVIIGNPPYGAKFSTKEKQHISKTFNSYKYKFESYIYFIEKSLLHLKPYGYLEFITPSLWMELEMAIPIRMIVFKEYDLQTIQIYGDNVFADAVVSTSSFRIQNKPNSDKLVINFKGAEYEVQKSSYVDNLSFQISYRTSPTQKIIIDKIDSNSKQLSHFGTVIQGITAYDKYRGQTEEIIKTRAYHFDYKHDEFCGHWLDGKDVERYMVAWSGNWLRYGNWLAAPREKRFFEGVRILFREIPGQNKRIQAAIELEDSYYGHSISPFKPFAEYEQQLYFILAIANSRLISWYGSIIFPNLGKEVFPKINPQDILTIPIPLLDIKRQQNLGNMAQNIQNLSSKLQTLRSKFLRRLQDNFAGVKITGAIEKFDMLDFAQFVKELAKQKINLSLKAQDEWEEYFNAYRTDCQSLATQIATTDQTIDKMVYELYGLTEEEIMLIENQ